MPSMKKLVVLALAATVSAQVSQIIDGQPQAPTSPVSIVDAAPAITQISDGQLQAPTDAPEVTPISQITDGQLQAPTDAPTPISQISDGQLQAPTAPSTGAPVPTSNGTMAQPSPVPFTGGAALVTFSGAALGLAALVAML
ncbi:MAG: hypothetical protein LQ341_004414 [Variospora aurantia]|nr:MAG: hypothetical protein LQ341_004414 [Variospora aurantia]